MSATARLRLERARVDQGLQIGPADQPHGHVQAAVDLADVVDRHDVGVVQPRGGAGFAAEPLVEIGVLGVVGEQHLQRDDAVDGGVVGAPHLAHAAAAQQLDQRGSGRTACPPPACLPPAHDNHQGPGLWS